jgi:hypothetical protein
MEFEPLRLEETLRQKIYNEKGTKAGYENKGNNEGAKGCKYYPAKES